MTPHEFKKWRKQYMKLTQKDAAKLLGMHPNTIAGYERGVIHIEIRTRLAMAALSLGLRDYTFQEVPDMVEPTSLPKST